jgi:serine/threonine protein kinase
VPQRRGTLALLSTTRYTPIELFPAAGESHCGPWTDLYALGAVLYHCVTGVEPPSARSRLLGAPLRLAEEAAAGPYSPALSRLIERAMAVRPEQRFQTAAQMRAALE